MWSLSLRLDGEAVAALVRLGTLRRLALAHRGRAEVGRHLKLLEVNGVADRVLADVVVGVLRAGADLKTEEQRNVSG